MSKSISMFCLAALTALMLGGCSESPVPATNTSTPAVVASTASNHLSMYIDGIEWTADHGLFGAFHPPGYERALLIAGARGAKDRNEQTMNINLFGINGPGQYVIRNGDPAGSVAQMMNYSPERFISGSMMGYDLIVEVSVAQTNPAHLEATFSGSLTGNDDVIMQIRDGRFSYRE